MRTLLPWFWPFALAATIFIASGRGDVTGPDIIGIDKAAHFGLFGLLAMLVVRNGFPPRRAWLAVVLVALFGLTDEWHQSFTPGRYVEIADWVADTLGAIVAVAVYVRWTRVRGWLETPLALRQRRIEKTAVLVPNQSA